jgi:hypothetical protein
MKIAATTLLCILLLILPFTVGAALGEAASWGPHAKTAVVVALVAMQAGALLAPAPRYEFALAPALARTSLALLLTFTLADYFVWVLS